MTSIRWGTQLALVAGIAWLTAGPSAQSLGDIARQAAARREKAEAGKKYTNTPTTSRRWWKRAGPAGGAAGRIGEPATPTRRPRRTPQQPQRRGSRPSRHRREKRDEKRTGSTAWGASRHTRRNAGQGQIPPEAPRAVGGFPWPGRRRVGHSGARHRSQSADGGADRLPLVSGRVDAHGGSRHQGEGSARVAQVGPWFTVQKPLDETPALPASGHQSPRNLNVSSGWPSFLS